MARIISITTDKYASFHFFLQQILTEVAKELKLSHHSLGTNVCIEGPRFSSKAESKMFQMWGGDIINMTAVPEVVLANEAGLCYAAIAMVTDYDCWRDDHEPVSRSNKLNDLNTACCFYIQFVSKTTINIINREVK